MVISMTSINGMAIVIGSAWDIPNDLFDVILKGDLRERDAVNLVEKQDWKLVSVTTTHPEKPVVKEFWFRKD